MSLVLFGSLANAREARGEECRGAYDARDSVFLLERGRTTVGAGFLYRDAETLVTAEHVAETAPTHAVDRQGRRFRLGKRIRDVRSDVAMYRLAQAVEFAPLVGEELERVGVAAFSVGHPRPEGMRATPREPSLNWSISAGTVTGADDTWIVSDVTVFGGNSGGPILSCDGRVLGVASHATSDLRFVWASRTANVDALVARGTDGDLSLVRDVAERHWEVAAQFGRHGHAGLGLTLHWPLRSSLWLNAGFSATTNALGADVVEDGSENAFRSNLEASFRWHPFDRWNFDPAIAVGVGVTAARYTTLTLVQSEDGAFGSVSDTDRLFGPAASLSVAVKDFTVGVSVDIDVNDPRDSRWWVWFGMVW